jgi:2-methylcitrate dehydratase PrpD
MAASSLAELGHTGDIQLLDDGEHGYRRMIGSARWAPERITKDLGQHWYFPAEQSYKPYPHCRILHGPLNVLIDIIEKNHIKPAEIEGIRAWVEAWVMQHLWMNTDIRHVTQAQFSMAHGLALGAHLIPPGKAWQQPMAVFDPSVLALMKKVECVEHPDYSRLVAEDPASRPTRIEVRARGETFVGEARYPKGSPTPDPSTYMTNDELSAKFIRNTEGVLSDQQASRLLESLWNLDQVQDFSELVPLFSNAAAEVPLA